MAFSDYETPSRESPAYRGNGAGSDNPGRAPLGEQPSLVAYALLLLAPLGPSAREARRSCRNRSPRFVEKFVPVDKSFDGSDDGSQIIAVLALISRRPTTVSFSPHSAKEMLPCARSLRSFTTSAKGPRSSRNLRLAAARTVGDSLSWRPTFSSMPSILLSFQLPPPPLSSLNSRSGSARTSKSTSATAYFNQFSAFISLLAATTTLIHSLRKSRVRSAGFHDPFHDAEASASRQRVIVASTRL